MADAGHRGRGKSRLRRYAQKRDFSKTAEPSTRPKTAPGKKSGSVAPRGKQAGQLVYVVQKHAASRLHWDFRLEWRGTLRSWAVPKGPSLDPADKRLAVEVEDHPLAYAKFSGDIPKGQYGGGHVDIWDHGTWEPVGDFDKGLAKGHVEFLIHGRKLTGKWHLVRTRMQGRQTQWLLMKSHDAAARTGANADVIDAGQADAPERQLAAPAVPAARQRRPKKSAAPRPRSTRSSGPRGRALPATLEPMLATLVDAAPGEGDWVYELKYDGVRLLCRCDGDDVRCISRNGLDWTQKAGPVVQALRALDLRGAWVDGELIATDPNGRSDFSLLQHVREQGRLEELQYCVFDLLYWKGEDLRDQPLGQRKSRLDAAFAKLPAKGPLRLADQLHSQSGDLLARVCNQHLEGLIAKRVGSRYARGRSADWLKIKCHREQEFVVGGAAYLPGRGTGTFSSLLVGVRTGKGGLRYVGRVGGGFDAGERREWHERAKRLARKDSPFENLPDRRSGENWHWMKPELVIQVAFADWTHGGVLRQPRYLGMRQDRDPATVVREEPAHTADVVKQDGAGPANRQDSRKAPAGGTTAGRGKTRTRAATAARGDADATEVSGQRLTHPDRVLFPHDGVTKLQLAEYLAAVSGLAMPHYLQRPLSILRNTHGSQPFFQKHFLDSSGAGLRIVKIPNTDKNPDFVVCDSPEGLLHLAQIGAVELHSWGAVMPKPKQADRLTFDLDPGADLDYAPLRDAALAIRKLLADVGLDSWIKTTGGKGLHVVVPLGAPRPDWDTAREFALSVTRFMERIAPTQFTSKSGERNRKRKIFVDYLRNAFGASAVAAYSPRWRPGVGVSTPVTWQEIDTDIRGAHFNIRNVPDRVARLRRDPWQDYWTAKQALTRTMIREMARK
ncbi:MAG TPA: DNA ligase D [Steroidobacteraceae bacterium]|nr:DNA ligase D [Steroidobacteraceae bacterium]